MIKYKLYIYDQVQELHSCGTVYLIDLAKVSLILWNVKVYKIYLEDILK